MVKLCFIASLVVGGVCAAPLAYLTTSTGQFGTLDLATGQFGLVATGTTLAGLGNLGSTLYGLDASGQLYSIDPATGVRTALGGSSHSFNVFGSTLTGLFAIDTSTNVYSIDSSNGAATLLGPTGIGFGAIDGLSTNSSTLYWADGTNLYTLNTSTGSATLIGPTGGSAELGAMTFENGTLWGGMYLPSSLVSTVNTTTGAVTGGPALTGAQGNFFGLAPDEQAPLTAPEPGTLALLVAGAFAFAAHKQIRSR